MSRIIIHAVDETFVMDVDLLTTQVDVDFVIPQHVYTRGWWRVAGSTNANYAVVHKLWTIRSPLVHASNGTIQPQTESYDDLPFPPDSVGLELTADQLSDVNVAAGGTLAAALGYSGGALPVGGQDTVVHVDLMLEFGGADVVSANTSHQPLANVGMVGWTPGW